VKDFFRSKVFIAYLAVLFLMFVFPPYMVERVTTQGARYVIDRGHSFLLSIPNDRKGSCSVDFQILFLQVAALSVLTTILYIVLEGGRVSSVEYSRSPAKSVVQENENIAASAQPSQEFRTAIIRRLLLTFFILFIEVIAFGLVRDLYGHGHHIIGGLVVLTPIILWSFPLVKKESAKTEVPTRERVGQSILTCGECGISFAPSRHDGPRDIVCPQCKAMTPGSDAAPQVATESRPKAQRMESKYTCNNCAKEFSYSDYLKLNDVFCPECGGEIEKQYAWKKQSLPARLLQPGSE